MTAISQIPGLEEWQRQSFVSRRIRTTDRLLHALKSQRQRMGIARVTSLAEPDLLQFANAADLMRIKGIGQHAVDLLRAAGVSTVRDLRFRNAQRLHRAILEANVNLNLSAFPPALNFVTRWIAQAKRLDLLITY